VAYTDSGGFVAFFDNINLTGDHHAIASARRERVVSLLSREFEILDSFATGSISNYTAVKEHADLDVILVLHWSKHIKDKKASEVLGAVQNHLSEFRTGRRNGQAVTLYYESWPDVDIVPVSRVVNNDNTVNYYSVPDMNDEKWLVSRPRKHSKALTDANSSFGQEFKKIVKMLKWWNHQHSGLMKSYHIEVLALKIFTGKTFSNFPWDVFTFFDQASTLTESLLFDDDGNTVDEYLYLKADKRTEILKRLTTAKDKTRDVWYATYDNRGEHARALGIWRQVFGDKFPTYG
jgi:hypothetical protein